jgi:hypothetical protein
MLSMAAKAAEEGRGAAARAVRGVAEGVWAMAAVCGVENGVGICAAADNIRPNKDKKRLLRMMKSGLLKLTAEMSGNMDIVREISGWQGQRR